MAGWIGISYGPSLGRAARAAWRTPAAAYILATLIDKGFSFITIPVMTHFMAPSAFGSLDVAVSFVEFAGLLATLGLAETLLRFASATASASERRVCAAETLGLSLLLAGALGAFLQALLPLALAIAPVGIDMWALRIAVAGASATALIEVPLMWLRLNQRAHGFLAFVCVRASLQAMAVCGVLLAGYGPAGILVANGVVALIFAGALLVFLLREVGVAVTGRAMRRQLAYGVPILLGLLAMFALGNCDRWFLASVVPPAEIAFYGLAAKLALATALVFQPFLMWWSARRLSLLAEENGPERVAEAWGLGVAVLLCGALGVGLAAPVFVVFGLPAAYAPALQWLPFLVMLSVLNEFNSLSNTGCYAYPNGMRVLAVNAGAAACAFAGYALLVPRFGIAGAIAATYLAQTLRLGLFLYAGRKAAPVRYRWGGTAAGIAIVLAAMHFAPPPEDLVRSVLWSGFTGLALAGTLVLTGLVPRRWLDLRNRSNPRFSFQPPLK
jgi:O-antigen/teichoic acid export membrane protein